MEEKSVRMKAYELDDGTPAGMILWKIDSISKLKMICSPIIEVHKMPWHVAVYKSILEGKPFLSVFLRGMKNDSIVWSVIVHARIMMFNKDKTKDYSRYIAPSTFNHSSVGFGIKRFLDWKELLNEEKGFITEDKITIRIGFHLNSIKGIRRVPFIDFTDSNEPRHDVTFVLEGKKLHASKQYLSLHSHVFNTMFYGDTGETEEEKMREEKDEEIKLTGVTYEDFKETLKVLYPSHKKITEENCKSLLSVGDRFQIKTIMDQVEQFLISCEKYTIAAKLKLSGEYRLMGLQKASLESIKTMSDVSDLKKAKEYNTLNDTTKLALLEKIMALVD